MDFINRNFIILFGFFSFIFYCICTALLLFSSGISAFIAFSIFFVFILGSEIYLYIQLGKYANNEKNKNGVYSDSMIEILSKKIIDRDNRIHRLEQEINELKGKKYEK